MKYANKHHFILMANLLSHRVNVVLNKLSKDGISEAYKKQLVKKLNLFNEQRSAIHKVK